MAVARRFWKCCWKGQWYTGFSIWAMSGPYLDGSLEGFRIWHVMEDDGPDLIREGVVWRDDVGR